jgi:hypothetical protein
LLLARLNVIVAQSVLTVGRRVCESVIPSTATTPDDTREIVVSDACPSSILPVVVIVPSVGLSDTYTIFQSVTAVSSCAFVVVTILVPREMLLFVRVSVVALPTSVSLAPVGSVRVPPDTFIAAILGVVSAGELENTRTHPLPVSSLITPASCAEVVEANCASVPEVSASHPPAGLDHFTPVASAESAVSTCQFVPTARRDAVFAPVPTAKSPFASHMVSVATSHDPPEIEISPLPRSELPFTVFILVHDTRVSCLPASHEVRADVSALSALRLAKFVFTCHRNDAPVIQSLSVVIVAIVFC